MNNLDLQKYYNKCVDDYANNFEGSSVSKKELDIFIAQLKTPQKARVLEVGSGLGQEAEYMSQKGCSVLGIDLSQEMTNYAWKHRKCGLYLTFDFFKVYDVVGGNHFDGLWASSSVLTHISKKNAPNFFLEARKLLKISGYMGIIVRKDKFNFKSKIVYSNYSKGEISQLMIENGFEILHISEKKFKDSKWWFVLSKRIG